MKVSREHLNWYTMRYLHDPHALITSSSEAEEFAHVHLYGACDDVVVMQVAAGRIEIG